MKYDKSVHVRKNISASKASLPEKLVSRIIEEILNEDIQSSLNFDITGDTNAPEILECPSNIDGTVEAGSPGSIVTWKEPSAVDVSGNATLLIKTHSPGEFFHVGNTSVSYVFVDYANNMATCRFYVFISMGKWILLV